MIAMPVTMMLGSILSGYIGDGRAVEPERLAVAVPAGRVAVGGARRGDRFYLNDTPDQASWLDDEEKQTLKTMIAREQELAVAHAATPRSTLREVLTPAVLLYTLAYFCLTNTLSAINIWTPQILQSFNTGSSNIVIGLLAAIPQFCTILGMIWWSRRSDRLKERKAHHPAVSLRGGGMDAGLGHRSQPDPAAWHHHGLNRIVYRHGDILDHAGSGY